MSTEESTTDEKIKETVLLGWKAPEFQTYERGIAYYSILATILLAVLTYAIFAKDWFIIAIFLVLTGFVLWYQKKKPETRTYRITQLGIYEDNRFYQYNEIYSYWFLIDGDYKVLNIIFAKKYLPQMTILLDKTDPVKVREILSKYIPEEGTRTETLLDKLVRLFKL